VNIDVLECCGLLFLCEHVNSCLSMHLMSLSMHVSCFGSSCLCGIHSSYHYSASVEIFNLLQITVFNKLVVVSKMILVSQSLHLFCFCLHLVNMLTCLCSY